MVCPACGTAYEGPRCPACGAAPPASAPAPASAPPPPPPPPWSPAFAYLCVRCGRTFTGPWCPYCGTPVGADVDPKAWVRAAASVLWSVAIVAFLVLIVTNLAALGISSSHIVDLALKGTTQPVSLFLLTPFPWGATVTPSPPAFLGYFALILTGILLACAWTTFRDGRATVRAFRSPIRDAHARLASRSGLVATAQVWLASFFFQFTFILLLEVLGFNPTAPTASGPLPPFYDYYALANASVYEEIVTRFVFIGIPLAFAAFVLGERAAAPGGRPVPVWRHLVGGTVNRDSPRPLVLVASLLIGLSSVVFGLAHVPAWTWWKFLPTMVGGLAIGYLFVRHGILAAILFHFAQDYLGALVPLTGSTFVGQALFGLFLLGLLALGLFFFAWYFLYVADVVNHVFGPPRAAAPTAFAAVAPPLGYGPPPAPYAASAPVPWSPPPPAPPYGLGFETFVCPACGWREARYEAGRFTCLQCGRVSP